MRNTPGFRPAPDAGMLVGSLAALAGYLLPWFKQQKGYLWSYSGWEYATLSTGGGWTLVTLAALSVAVVASLWAGGSVTAARWGAAGLVAALFLALTVVAASLATIPERSNLNYMAELPFGVGLPLMAVGFGTGVAASLVAVVRATVAAGPPETGATPAP